MTPLPGDVVDVAVVGAGVVGCAVARELARHPVRTVVVDAGDDVGTGTSKANTAVLHTGYDATPGTLESRLVARGYALLSTYADECGIAVERTGALLVAWDREQLDALPRLADKAAANGYRAARPVDVDELYRLEPHLGAGALGALEVPGESVIDPWSPTLAFARQAVAAGVELHLRTAVTGVDRLDDGTHLVRTDRGELRARWLVNAAGLHADDLDRMLGFDAFSVTPRRGQLLVFDKLARPLVRHVLLPVPGRMGKGVLVAPTVFGNVLLGPTAEDLDDKTDTASTAEGIESLRDRGRRILPALLDEEVTAVYAGLRAATEHADYAVRVEPDRRYLCLGGIRSTGLTASMALAEHAGELLADAGLDLGPARDLEPVRLPWLGETGRARPYLDADAVGRDPDYGRLVCHCERVSRGELRDSLAGPLAAATLDGLRRRTRALNGRCQGFYCSAAVRAALAEATR